MKRSMVLIALLVSMVDLQAKVTTSFRLLNGVTRVWTGTKKAIPPCVRKIKVVNIDTGGVRGDDCCRQPVQAFEAAVESLGLNKEDVQDLIYSKMGMSKRPHLEQIVFSEKGTDLFAQANHRYPVKEDIDNAYEVFLDVQRALLLDGYPMIPGCAEAQDRMTKMGLTLIGTTGYNRELRDITNLWLSHQGSNLSGSITPEDCGGGRPAPWQIFAVIKKMYDLTGEIIKPSEVVTVDDTATGMEAGKNAGTWCVGIAGTSILQNQYPGDFAKISDVLLEGGAHLVVNSIVNVPDAIDAINKYLEDPLASPETFVAYLEQVEGD